MFLIKSFMGCNRTLTSLRLNATTRVGEQPELVDGYLSVAELEPKILVFYRDSPADYNRQRLIYK